MKHSDFASSSGGVPSTRGPSALRVVTGLVFVAAVASPLFNLDAKDSFPISTYPMFAGKKERLQIVEAVGIDARGQAHTLTPQLIADDDEPMQAIATIRQSIEGGPATARALCKRVAKRVAEASQGSNASGADRNDNPQRPSRSGKGIDTQEGPKQASSARPSSAGASRHRATEYAHVEQVQLRIRLVHPIAYYTQAENDPKPIKRSDGRVFARCPVIRPSLPSSRTRRPRNTNHDGPGASFSRSR